MTLEQYWTIMARQWKLIVTCFVLTGLAAYLVSKFMTPTYQATTLVQVKVHLTGSQGDYNSLLASNQLVTTEAQLAVSDPVLRQVVPAYPGLTVDQLSKEASSDTKTSTQLFEITVEDSNPVRAASLANAIATTLVQQQAQETQQENLQQQQQIQNDLTNTRQQIDSVTSQLASLSGKHGQSSQIAVLQAQLSGLQQHYSQWQTVLAQLELTQAQGGSFLEIVQMAQPPVKPVRPNTLLNTGAGLLGGLFLGILLAIAFVSLDTRVRTAEALEDLLGWSILGTIWRVRSARSQNMINPRARDANVESYRILRTNIGFAGIDKPLHTLAITSAVPVEGKSVIASNLAIFMAKAGKKTLLIDADLRRPTLHEKFAFSPDKKGLSNAILAFSTVSTADQQPLALPEPHTSRTVSFDVPLAPFIHEVGIPHLQVMPSGPLPPNSTELLDSKAMQRFLTALAASDFEVVLFDSPPLLGLSDANILAARVDGAIVVADLSRARKKNLKQVKALLTQAGAHVLGCVVNKVHRSSKDTPYNYYYQADQADPGDGQSGKNGTASPPSLPVSIPSKGSSS